MKLRFFALLVAPIAVAARVIDFEVDAGGIVDLDDDATAMKNGALMNSTFASLTSGDTLIFPNKTFHVMGGIMVNSMKDVTISFDGTLVFSNNIDLWPKEANGNVFECLHFDQPENVIFTSSGKGTLDGRGKKWWGLPGIGYLERAENRPRLFSMGSAKNVKVENILFKNSPYWTFWAPGADGLEISHCDIFASREDKPTGHGGLELTAFNTDGFDVTGTMFGCMIWRMSSSPRPARARLTAAGRSGGACQGSGTSNGRRTGRVCFQWARPRTSR